jgi:hypothetical protein
LFISETFFNITKQYLKPKTMSDTKITTGLVRLSFVNVWEAKADQKGKMFYSICAMVPKKDTATIKAIGAAVEAAKVAKWGFKVPKGLKLPLRDGDADEEDKGEEFAGMMFFNCKSKNKVGLIDSKRQEVLEEDRIYSGVWGKVNVNFYGYEVEGSKGVAVGLNAVQRLKDDDKLGGGGWSGDDFKDEKSFDGEDDI